MYYKIRCFSERASTLLEVLIAIFITQISVVGCYLGMQFAVRATAFAHQQLLRLNEGDQELNNLVCARKDANFIECNSIKRSISVLSYE